MNTKPITTKIQDGADSLEEQIQVGANKLANGAAAMDSKVSMLEEQLRDLGNRFLGNAKQMSGELSAQARLHPLATVGIAVAAGIVIARLLRR